MRTGQSSLRSEFARFDDLRIVGKDLSDRPGFTLTCLVRNETYFLPAFLEHYRALGVERFVFVDDRSTDGSREFLSSHADCMVLASSRRYSDVVTLDPGGPNEQQKRMIHVWINLLISRYASDRWVLHVDADEFLRLPDGVRLPDVARKVDAAGAGLVWSVMLDLYPSTLNQLRVMESAAAIDRGAEWYYDACEHLRIRSNGKVRMVYPGSRARLMKQYRIRRYTGFRAVRSVLGLIGYNRIHKPNLMKLPADGYIISSHSASMRGAPEFLLPLEHHKFAGHLNARTAEAIASGSHSDNSVEYRDMEKLLRAIEDGDGLFTCPWSSSDRSFEAYRRAGIAKGL